MPRVLLLEPLADVASTSFCCCVASAEPPSARVSGLLPRGREQFESEAASSGSYFTNPGLFKSAGISDLFSILPFPVVNLHGFFYRGFYPLLRLPL